MRKGPRGQGIKTPRGDTRPRVYDRHDLYELCVQDPALIVPLLRAIHARGACALREDFCAAAAVARRWCREVPGARATGVDLDAKCLARARRARVEGLTLVRADVRTAPLRGPQVDVVFVGNFSIGELHTRDELVRYLDRTRRRLARRGVLVCDTYGGQTAFTTGAVVRTHNGPPDDPGLRVRYTWQQRHADPLTGRVTNAIHFRTLRAGEIQQDITDAFVYDWRLWSVPELRDAMRDAGFRTSEVYSQLPDARDDTGQWYVRPVDDPAELGESYIVCVCGRA